MQRDAWKDIANWRTKLLNHYTKSQLHELRTINSKKKKWDLWENCEKYAHNFFENVCAWQELLDLIFHGQ